MDLTFSTSDLNERIRDHQDAHSELKRSHHFVFDCPLESMYTGKPDYIWFGVNPGSDDEDWTQHGENTEETRDYDFQLERGRSEASTKRMKKIRKFLGPDRFGRTTHCELFFWCSKNTGRAFDERFGYSFATNPHWDFCCQINRKLIKRVQPKAVLAESRGKLGIYSARLGLRRIKPHRSADGETLIEELELEGGIPFYCFDHLSARISNPRRAEIKRTLAALLGVDG